MARINECTKNRSKRKPRSQPLFSGCGNGSGQKTMCNNWSNENCRSAWEIATTPIFKQHFEQKLAAVKILRAQCCWQSKDCRSFIRFNYLTVMSTGWLALFIKSPLSNKASLSVSKQSKYVFDISCLICFRLTLTSFWHPQHCSVMEVPSLPQNFGFSNVLAIKILFQAHSWQSDDYLSFYQICILWNTGTPPSHLIPLSLSSLKVRPDKFLLPLLICR